MWWSGCGCGCGAHMATPPACQSTAPLCWAPGSKLLLSAFLRMLPHAQRIIVMCQLVESLGDDKDERDEREREREKWGTLGS